MLLSILLLNCALLVTAKHIHRHYLLGDSKSGDTEGTGADWNDLCVDGCLQSPIKLAKDKSTLALYPSLNFHNFENPLISPEIENTGETYKIPIPSAQDYVISGGELPGTYKLDQMHFHWPLSEHTIDGKHFALEFHLVSHNQRYDSLSEALQYKQGVAVLAVLFHISDQVNPVLENILDNVKEIENAPYQSTKINASLSPEQLLPIDRSSYFRYEGSLTTSPYSEVVVWTVLTDTLPISPSQIERFKQMENSRGSFVIGNFRQLQKRNSRPIFFVTDNPE